MGLVLQACIPGTEVEEGGQDVQGHREKPEASLERRGKLRLREVKSETHATPPTSSMSGCEGKMSQSLPPLSPQAASVSLSVCFYFHQSLSVSAPLPCASPICAQKPPSLSAPAPAHRSYFGRFGCSRKPNSSEERFLRPPARTTRSTRPAPPWDSRTGKSQRGAAKLEKRDHRAPSGQPPHLHPPERACVTCHHGNGRASSPANFESAAC